MDRFVISIFAVIVKLKFCFNARKNVYKNRSYASITVGYMCLVSHT